MKINFHIVLSVIIIGFSAQSLSGQSYFGTVPETNISLSLKQKEVSHHMKYWPLQIFSGNDKIDVQLQAVLYDRYHSAEKLSGIKVTISDNGKKEECIAHGARQFDSYIEKEEYAKIIVSIDQMIAEIKNLNATQQFGAMNYISKGGIKIGFEVTEISAYGYLGIQYSEALILCQFSNTEKFLNDLRSALNIATKELYLPKNENKLKRVKKGSQEIQDIKVDDI